MAISVRDFYDKENWTLPFWARGDNYTIVPGRHIGLDIAPGGAIDIPAIYGGHVIIVTKTRTMGWIVVLDTHLEGSRRYHSYCHLSAVNLPRPKEYIYPGDRVGKLAAGPKTLAYENAEFPGSLWTGVHLHLVMSSFSTGAYTKNTGSTYANPAIFILDYFSGAIAGGGATPFEPEEDMTPQQAADLAEVAAFVRQFKESVRPFEGQPGVDLSTPRIRQAVDSSIDLRHRFVYRDANGTPTYDLAQLVQNEIKPMLLTLISEVRDSA